jgi:hypothetical protein
MTLKILNLLNPAAGFTVCDISVHINKPPVPDINEMGALFYSCLNNRINIDNSDFEAIVGK